MPNLRLLRAACAAAFLFVASPPLRAAPWQELSGSLPGSIGGDALVSDGTYVYLSGDGGIYRSANGTAWSAFDSSSFPASNGPGNYTLGDLDLRRLMHVNGILWAFSAPGSLAANTLWRSTDQGATWTTSGGGFALGNTADGIGYDASTGLYYLASNLTGFHVSTDAGFNWTPINGNLPTSMFFDARVAHDVFARGGEVLGTMIVGTFPPLGGAWKSENGGFTWEHSNDDLLGVGNAIDADGRIIIVGTGANLLIDGSYYTDDFGDTWQKGKVNPPFGRTYNLAWNGATAFAAADHRLYYSANRGESWDLIETTGLASGYGILQVESHGSAVYATAGDMHGDVKAYRVDLTGMDLRARTHVVTQPVGGSWLEGDQIVLTATGIGHGTLSYRWKKDGVDVPGGTSATLTIDEAELADGGLYTVVITGGNGVDESVGAIVNVKPRVLGEVDPQFALPPGQDTVWATLVDSDGNVWFGGDFNHGGNPAKTLIKLHPHTGAALATVPAGYIRALAETPTKQVWAGTSSGWLQRISKAGAIEQTIDIKLGAGVGLINAIAPYGDAGKIIVAGHFDSVGGVAAGPLVLINADGSIDASFDPKANGLTNTAVEDVEVGPESEIYIIEATYNTVPGQTHAVAKLLATGAIDNSWWIGGKHASQARGNLQGDIKDIAVAADGAILVGARNTSGSTSSVITSSSILLRFRADGTWDGSFNPGGAGPQGGNRQIYEIAIAPDGKIVIVGDFDGYNTAVPSSVNRNITRLLADGTPDPYWNLGKEGWRGSAYSADIGLDGSVYAGSDDVWYNDTYPTVAFAGRMLKLVGDVDPVAIVDHPDDLILDLGETARFKVGAFGSTAVTYQWRKDNVEISGQTSATLELSNVDGDDDGYYDVVVTTSGGTLVSSAGRLITIEEPKFVVQPQPVEAQSGDSFTVSVEAVGLGTLTYQWFHNGEPISGATDESYTVDFASTSQTGDYHVEVTGSEGTSASAPAVVVIESFPGALDKAFDTSSGFNNQVFALNQLEDGSLIVGGFFTQYAGEARSYLAKLDAEGALVAGWPATAPNYTVYAVARQDDGKFLVGGQFSAAGGYAVGLERLNADGSVDATFNDGGAGFGPNTYVYQIAVQADGKILVLTDPATYNGPAEYNGEDVQDLFRLEADGTLDESFLMADTNVKPKGFRLLRDGKIVVYGDFATVNGESHARIVRLNTDGSIDGTFALGAGPDSRVNSVDEASDGKLVLGGWFQNLGGFNRRYVAMLNADGSVYESFDTSTVGGSYPSGFVEDAEALLNGDVLIIGSFLIWGTQPQATPYRIATLDRQGQRTGFATASQQGFSSNPTDSFIEDGPGYAFVAGNFTGYHGQNALRIAKIHLEEMGIVFLAHPEDEYVEAGETAIFVAELFGSSDVSYQWYKDNVAISGANAATLEIEDAGESDEGTYKVVAVNASGIIESEAELTILAEPVILSSPGHKLVDSGDGFTLSLAVIGAEPLEIQWYRGETLLAGEAGSTLFVPGATSESAGAYRAVISNGHGDAETPPAYVSVQFPAAGVDPAFTVSFFGSPAFGLIGKTVDDGYRVAGTFSNITEGVSHYAKISGAGAIDPSVTSGVGLPNGVNYGDFGPDGSLTFFASGNALRRLKPDGSEDGSFAASGISWPNFNGPRLTVAADGSVFVADNNTFAKVTAAGALDASFNSGGSGPSGYALGSTVAPNGKVAVWGNFTAFNGQARAGLAVLNADGSLDEDFDLGAGFDDSVHFAQYAADGALYVGGAFANYKGAPAAGLVRLEPDGDRDASFVSAGFSYFVGFVAAPSGLLELPDGNLAIRGLFNNYGADASPFLVVVSPTGARVASFPNVNLNAQVGDFLVEADGKIALVGGFTSPKNRIFRVNPEPPALAILQGPAALELEQGASATLSVAARGQGPLGFQWQLDGEDIQGANSQTYVIADAGAATDGSYTVVVTGGGVSIESAPAVVDVDVIEIDNVAMDAYLGTLGIAASDRSFEDDPDGDGVSNVIEYLMGFDPSEAGSMPTVEEGLIEIAGVEYLSMTFQRDTAITDLALEPQFSATVTFAAIIDAVEVSVVELGGGLQRVTVRSSVSIGAGAQFGRIGFEPAP